MIFLFRMNVCTRVFVAGNSMNPTYYNGDVLIVWKIDKEPKEYDVVIAKIDGMEVVKRVVARPGDYVFMTEIWSISMESCRKKIFALQQVPLEILNTVLLFQMASIFFWETTETTAKTAENTGL